MTDEKLIEEAAKAIADVHNEGAFEKWPDGWIKEARAALAVFREHTAPTDEREELARIIDPEAWKEVEPRSAAFCDDPKAQEIYEGFYWQSVRERREPSLRAADAILAEFRLVPRGPKETT